MPYVFYDTETTDISTAFAQILQFAAIKTDDDLNEIDRFQIRCRLLPHVVPAPKALLVTKISRFENAIWSGVDFVNSSFALPLCRKTDFLDIWQRIYDSLRSGGRFSGQLYGDRDEWAGNPTNTHFTPAEVQTMIGQYDVENFWEEETDSVTPRGTLKHWHIYHIVARKP